MKGVLSTVAPGELFCLPGENADDIRHSLAEGSREQYVLRVALAIGAAQAGGALRLWQTHQIELDLWCHLRPLPEELEVFRRHLQLTFMGIPWMFSPMLHRIGLGRPLVFADMQGFMASACAFLPCGCQVLYDSWAMAVLQHAVMPSILITMLSQTMQANLLGVPYLAGTMLDKAVNMANSIVADAEKVVEDHPLTYDRGGYLPL